MHLDRKSCYAALKSHDTRFDGRFFVGIASTGIYCRPVCRVKTPLEKNCTFYPSAAAAEASGYRPCMRCRPELAPGHSGIDAATRLARKAAKIIEENRLLESDMAELAAMLGITDRHLRRVFAAEFGVSPVRYLQTCRLLLAKSLLTDTSLSITKIAMSAGFGSIRRFNDLFKTHYRLTPSDFRKQGRDATGNGCENITLRLGYRPPYHWNRQIGFLADRAIPGVESVKEDVYWRTIALRHGNDTITGWISVKNIMEKNTLAVTLSQSLLPVLPKVLANVRHLFDLDCDPTEIDKTLEVMNEYSPGLYVPGTRLPGCFDAFEMSVRAILGQQITVKAARTLVTRLAMAFGDMQETPFGDLNTTFPTPETICNLGDSIEDRFGSSGITKVRSRTIFALADGMSRGDLDLTPQADPETETQKLLAMPGIGPWTAQYIAMRALGWPDAFPHTDYGVKNALDGLSEREILQSAEAWRPWRAYATINLWHSLKDKERK